MRVQGGLKPEDWQSWGQFTTFKTNAAELLRRELRAGQSIYCSPLVDPYQPAEEQQPMMPAILESVSDRPPRVFVLQTRGPLILRDLELLRKLTKKTTLRVSFSITTDNDQIRRWYEPHCAANEERLAAIRVLRSAGIETYATLAPLLPCDPEKLAIAAIEASGRDLIGDPLHIRASKPRGATTREQAVHISHFRGFEPWHDVAFQTEVVNRVKAAAKRMGHRFDIGPAGFSRLAK